MRVEKMGKLQIYLSLIEKSLLFFILDRYIPSRPIANGSGFVSYIGAKILHQTLIEVHPASRTAKNRFLCDLENISYPHPVLIEGRGNDYSSPVSYRFG